MVFGKIIQFSPRGICDALEIVERGDDEFEYVNLELVRAIIALNGTTNLSNVGILTLENRTL